MIDVVFAGLMVLCFEGHSPECTETGWNTAWVIDASRGTLTCGRRSLEQTELTLSYEPTKFTKFYGDLDCFRTKDIYYDDNDIRSEIEVERCWLGKRAKEICLNTEDVKNNSNIDSAYMLSMMNLEKYLFIGWNNQKLIDSSGQKIRFGHGVIASYRIWRAPLGRIVSWNRSDGTLLEKKLASEIAARYLSESIRITDCRGGVLLDLKAKDENAALKLENFSYPAPVAEIGHDGAYYDQPAYLLWYSMLGTWKNTYSCPSRGMATESPLLLRCRRNSASREDSCAFNFNASTTFWPPVIK